MFTDQGRWIGRDSCLQSEGVREVGWEGGGGGGGQKEEHCIQTTSPHYRV